MYLRRLHRRCGSVRCPRTSPRAARSSHTNTATGFIFPENLSHSTGFCGLTSPEVRMTWKCQLLSTDVKKLSITEMKSREAHARSGERQRIHSLLHQSSVQ